MAGVTVFAVGIHILVPLGILCLDEFGVAFGNLVEASRYCRPSCACYRCSASR